MALPNVFATLSNSTFDAGDGNLVLNDDGSGANEDLKDWENIGIDCPPGTIVGCALDLQRSTQDNSFGQGTDENDAVPTVTNGSIPNNKSDLTRFYAAGEASPVDSNVLLYLGWERVQEPNGTTNMDFELNQNGCNTPDPTDVEDCSTNGVTPDRTAGDVLIKYDLAQGGDTVALGFHTWVATGNDPSLCQQGGQGGGGGQKPPCWGPVHSLGADGEASINATPVTDPIPPNNPRTLGTRTFGEAAVDLTDAGLVAEGECVPFASAYLKSRSSDSFSSEIKDFVAPVALALDTCGDIKVKKTDDANNAVGDVVFNAYKDVAPTGPPDGAGPNQDAHGVEDTLAGSCTTAASTSPGPPATVKGECTIPNLQPGNYWVEEDPATVPPEYSATAAPKYVTVTAGGTANAFNPPFVNPRKHKVIVLVCHEGTNDLVKSDVTNTSNTNDTNDSTKKTSLENLPAGFGATEADVCGLLGASYGGKGHVPDDPYLVDIGQSPEGTPHP
ncbi:MAG: SpaA isopeptide-forming pilin-related protein [Solirubrobacterales bacterium]